MKDREFRNWKKRIEEELERYYGVTPESFKLIDKELRRSWTNYPAVVAAHWIACACDLVALPEGLAGVLKLADIPESSAEKLR